MFHVKHPALPISADLCRFVRIGAGQTFALGFSRLLCPILRPAVREQMFYVKHPATENSDGAKRKPMPKPFPSKGRDTSVRTPASR